MPITSTFVQRCSRFAWFFIHIALITRIVPGTVAHPVAAAPVTTPPAMWVTDGMVATTVVSENTVYIGGSFSIVGPPTGGFGAVDPQTGTHTVTTPNVDGIVYAMAEDGAGGWYIGGTFAHVGGLDRNNLAHIRADGTTDPTWDPNATTSAPNPYRVVWALAVSHGAVYIGGEFTQIGGQPRRFLAAVDAMSGSLTAWDIQTDQQVWAIVADGSRVYVGGLFTTIAGAARGRLAALDITTRTIADWNPNPSGAIAALALYDDTLYATGGFSTIGGQERGQIAALDPHTGVATSWNPNTSPTRSLGRAFGLAVNDSTVYVGGEFDGIGGKGRHNIAAIDRQTGDVTDWNPGADNWVMQVAVSGNTVYASGMFNQSGGQPRYRVAALDVTTGLATDWDPHLAWVAVHTVSPYADSNLPGVIHPRGTSVYIGGAFTSIGGVTRTNLAALDATTGGVRDWSPTVDDDVRSLILDDTTMYIGGNFTHVEHQPRNRLAAFDMMTGTLTPWNPDADGRVMKLAANETTIYAGGSFTTIGGQARTNIAAIDRTTGTVTSWHPDANATVSTVVVSGTTVYAGGSFTTIGGQPRTNLAALTTSNGAATTWNPNPTSDTYTEVNALAVRGNSVYVGGRFTAIGGQQRNSLAALDATTGAATSWKPIGVNDVVGVIISIVPSGSVVYVGGGFIQIGTQPLGHLVAIDGVSGASLPWGTPVSGRLLDNSGPAVLDLAVSASTVYVAGVWKNAGTFIQPSFAAFAHVKPFVRTHAATDVTETSATLHGTVTAYSTSASVAFEYTTIRGDYTNAITVDAVPGTVTGTSETPVQSTLSGLSPGTTYFYRVVAMGDGGTAIGEEQYVTTIARMTPPTILQQPPSLSIAPGTSVTLTVDVTGTAPFTYQWYQGNSGDTSIPIAGATISSFTTPLLTSTTRYWVRVSNAAGSVDSTTALITVTAAPTGSFMIYLPLMRR